MAAAVEEIAGHSEKQKKLAADLGAAHKENIHLIKEQAAVAAELAASYKELAFQNEEKAKRAAELVIANEELAFQNGEKAKRAAELVIANEELAFQNQEKACRAAELAVANKELAFQNQEKADRAAELEHFLQTAAGDKKIPGAAARSFLDIPRHLAFLVAGLVLAFSCGGDLLYRNTKINVYAGKYAELKAIGELKAGGLSNWWQERLNNAASLSLNLANESLVRPFLENTAPAQTAGDIKAWLENVLKSYDYEDAALVDNRGRVRLFVGIAKPALSQLALAGIKEVQRSQRPGLGGIYDKADNVSIPHLNLYVPLLGRAAPGAGGKCMGVLMFRINPERFLYPYIQSWPAPSRTAETLLLSREGDTALFLNKLRHSSAPPLSLRFPLSRKNSPAIQAVLGHEGAFEGKDYRGVKVLADFRPVPGTPWFIVSKVDSEEILSGLYLSAWLILVFTCLCILLSAGLITLLYNVRQRNAYRNLSVVNAARLRSDALLEDKLKDLLEKNAELERFLYTASHDLKSPVVTVRSFLGYLEKDLAGGNAARAAADIGFIRAAADKMAELLDDLLGISRIGRVITPPALVTLQAVADEALAAVAGKLSERGVRTQVAGGTAALFGDRLRLAEIWQNLVENACKYMGPQKEPRIDIGFEARGAERVFFVRDNGMGIDPRFLVKIFGLFEKLDAKAEGSGIGLAIVQRIVGLYGGRIWAESAGEGQGSVFYFTLPGAVSNEPQQGEKP